MWCHRLITVSTRFSIQSKQMDFLLISSLIHETRADLDYLWFVRGQRRLYSRSSYLGSVQSGPGSGRTASKNNKSAVSVVVTVIFITTVCSQAYFNNNKNKNLNLSMSMLSISSPCHHGNCARVNWCFRTCFLSTLAEINLKTSILDYNCFSLKSS